MLIKKSDYDDDDFPVGITDTSALTMLIQGFSLASAIGHSPKIVPDVREFAVQFGQFVRDDFRKRTL